MVMHTLKSILSIVLFISTSSAFAEAKVEMINDMVPENWILVYYSLGDVNHDNKEDAIMVIENTEAAYLKRNKILGPKILNMNPRQLMVLFQTPTGYKEVMRVNNGFPTEHSAKKPCLADPLVEAGSIKMDHGIVKVALGYHLNCSGYDSTNHTFSFRYEDGRFRLIGFDASTLARISGDASERSIDYLSSQQKTVTGINQFEQKPQRIKYEKIATQRLYLDEISLACSPDDQTTCKERLKH